MGALKQQIFLAFFFILLTGNTLFCHSVGIEFLENARIQQEIIEAGGDPTGLGLDERQLGRGTGLLLINFPYFIVLGSIMRSADPTPGAGYWIALILGATYVPFLITLCAYYLFHPPGTTGLLPGVDPNDESYKEEDEDDDAHS